MVIDHDGSAEIVLTTTKLLQAMRNLNSELLSDNRVFVSVLANADGLSLVVKK